MPTKILPAEDIDDFEDEDDDPVIKAAASSARAASDVHKTEISSYTSAGSGDSASATLMSSHAMRMGLYSINLGTKMGQRLHAAHMLILPLIPVFILLAQNAQNYVTFLVDADEILSVQRQVSSAVDLSNLVNRLQDERISVALNIFLKRSPNDDLQDLQKLVTNKVDIRRFTLLQVSLL